MFCEIRRSEKITDRFEDRRRKAWFVEEIADCRVSETRKYFKNEDDYSVSDAFDPDAPLYPRV